jgi:hypothetical protein
MANKSTMTRIAEALEMQNQLFREWIILNREASEQNMKMRAELFPLEMEKARLELGTLKSFAKLEETLNEAKASVDSIAKKVERP